MSTSPFMIPQVNTSGSNGMGGSVPPNVAVKVAPGGPGNFGFGNSGNGSPPMASTTDNPYAPVNSTFAQPTTGVSQNPTGAPVDSTDPSAGSKWNPNGNSGLFGSTLSQQTTEDQSIANLYGGGIGGLVSQYLASEGGYNSGLTTQAVDSQVAAMQQQIQQGMGNLQTNLAETGISPNSSVSALEQSNYEAQATTQENAITAQEFYTMWNQSQSNENSVLQGVMGTGATAKANQGNVLGTISSFLGLGQSAAGGASAVTSAISPSSDTSFLDAIAAF